MPGEKGLLSLLVVLLVAGTAVYLPSPRGSLSAPAGSGAAGATGDKKDASAASSSRITTYDDVVSLVASHFGITAPPDLMWQLDEGDPSVADAPRPGYRDTFQSEYPHISSRLDALRGASDFSLRFLVATVPDPIDSNARWQFDPMYDSIQRAMSANGYSLDRFYIPDWDPTRNPDTDKSVGAMHERLPGVVLFRRQAGAQTQFLAVLLAFETATGGIHQRSLRRALWMAAEGSYWQCARATDCQDGVTIPVLGPIFSGSIPSLGNAIAAVSRQFGSGIFFRVISGAATNKSNKDTLIQIAGSAALSYSTTVLSDDDVLDAVGRVLSHRVGTHRRAVLIESNTVYGAALTRRLVAGSPMCPSGCTVLPFPLHISRLRSVVDGTPPASTTSPTRRGPPLSLDEPISPQDQVPSMAPRLTSSSTDVAIAQILSTINREQLTVIGLFATDARDKLFLAQQISSRSPDALLFTVEGDLLFTHPDYVPYTRGMIVAGSYPLFTGSQLWSPTATGGSPRQQFASMNAEGEYNAAVALLDYDTEGKPVASIPMLDYRRGSAKAATAGPHLWITVVGRESIWPLDREDAPCDSCAAYAPPAPPTPTFGDLLLGSRAAIDDDLPVHPSVTLVVLLLVFEGWAIYFLRGRLPWALHADAAYALDSQPAAWSFCRDVALAATQYAVFVGLNSYRSALDPYASSEVFLGFVLAMLAETGAAIILLAMLFVVVAQFWAAALRSRIAVTAAVTLTLLALPFLLATVFPADPTLTLNRGLQLFSGASPFAPVIVVLAALYAWPAVQLARATTPTLSRLPATTPAGGEIDRLTSPGLVRLANDAADAIEEHPFRWMSSSDARLAWFAAALSAAFLILFFVIGVQTIESNLFDAFFLAGWFALQLLVVAALVAHFRVWNRTKKLLKAFSVEPITAAFSDVPRALFANRLPPRRPRLIHLRYAISAYGAAADAASLAPPESQGARLAAYDTLHASLDEELADRDPNDIAKSATWTKVLDEIAAVVPQLKSYWQKQFRGRDGASTWQSNAELFIAISIAVMIRELSARVVRGMYVLFGALSALVVYETSFRAYPRGLMLFVTWIYVGVGVGTALATVVSAERDVVLSHLAGTTPGKIEWDSAFVARTVIPLLFALFTLFATQFPAAGDLLMQWLRPVQTAIP